MSDATRRILRSISSSVNKTRSIAGGFTGTFSLSEALRQPVLHHQVLHILLIEDLDVHMWINGSQQPDLSILPCNVGLLHGGQLHVQVKLRQVEIRREGF